MATSKRPHRTLLAIILPILALVLAALLIPALSPGLDSLRVPELRYKLRSLTILLALMSAGVVADALLRGAIYDAVMRWVAGCARRPRAFMGWVAALTIIILAGVAWFGLETFPNSGDEYAYLFQADTFRAGRLWNEVPPVEEAFHTHHIGQLEGKWVSMYPPGWPAVLAAAGSLRLPYWLVNPMLGAALLAVLFVFARRRFGGEVAVVAVVATASTSFFLFTSASYFSHALCALFVLLFIERASRYLDDRRWIQALVAGVWVGAAFTVRYYTALVCVLPWLIYVLLHQRWRAAVGMVAAGVGALPFIGFTLWYNGAITGDPLLTPITWIEGMSLGFIRGHTLGVGVEMVVAQLAYFAKWTSPVLFLGYFGYLVTAWRRPRPRFHAWILFALVVAHMFYWSGGATRYGPRYYYEGFALATLFVAARLFGGRDARMTDTVLRYAFIFGTLAWLWMIPANLVEEHRVIRERQDLYDLVDSHDLHQAVVVITADTCPSGPMFAENLTRNGISLDRDVLYALDRGADRLAELRAAFPDRSFYVYRRPDGEVHGVLEPLP